MKQKIALITGGGKGIGKGIVLEMANNGYNVVINYSKSVTASEETADEAASHGVDTMLVKADVSTKEGCQLLVDKTITRFGKIDVLINNAGIDGKQANIWEFPDEEFEKIMRVNVFSQFYMLKYAAKHMITNPDGGSVINIASISAVYGVEAFAGYVTSKGGSMTLTKTAARDLAPYNINCNAIAPGIIGTDMILNLPPQAQDELKGIISMKRFGTPGDIGSTAVFLASEGARYITGQTLVVDGICRM